MSLAQRPWLLTPGILSMHTRSLSFCAALLGAVSLAACSGGSGGGGGISGFQLTSMSVQSGAVWQINREIEFQFSDPIDFSTVNLNTISIRTSSGDPASGTFSVKMLDLDGDGREETPDPATIVFQPTCPTKSDLSDAGLKIGGVVYDIVVAGLSSGALNTVRTRSGQALRTTQRRSFLTPNSTNPGVAFLDSVNGPPAPVVRNVGSTEQSATYLEIGGDTSNRVYFEFDPVTQTVSTEIPGFLVPVNLYSDVDTQVAILLEFNQPVSPSAGNISSQRLRLEFRDGTGQWKPLNTRVELVANCTTTGGATVRLNPVGILPEASQFRAVVLPGFQDLSGETNLLALDKFAVAPTETVGFSSLTPTDQQGDELLEEFVIGGTSIDSFQDNLVLFDTSPADWGDGTLTAGFTFDGTGGPGGDFDVVIGPLETLLFDTNSSQVIGGPGGVPTTVVTAVGGVLDCRDLIIADTGLLRVTGPNPMVINAARNVIIRGTLDVSGFSSKDVATLNTGNQAEIGGNGAAGGGKGGNASSVLNNSTPRGDRGFGAFGTPNGGGQGGESGYAPGSMGKNSRRPGGGGGGGFGPVQFRVDPANPGMNLEVYEGQNGFDGHPNSRGAETNQSPAKGGLLGPSPFADADPTNDFFGVRPYVTQTTMGPVTTFVQGELPRTWAGSGGGGGGNAVPSDTFPQANWNFGSDEKGGGGAGGAGVLDIRALGTITLGANGQIVAEGGIGAAGENTNLLDHVGGSGGGGSGGQVILQTASTIDFTDGSVNVNMNWPLGDTGFSFISTRGGPGGPGSTSAFWSRGGRGAPGILQMHVPDPITKPGTPPGTGIGFTGGDIYVPLIAAVEADPLNRMTEPPGFTMVPTFGARSKARSKWISIGGADQDPSGVLNPVQFLFGGVDTTPGTTQGTILATGGVVNELPPILGGTAADLVNAGGDATTQASGAILDIANAGGTLDALIQDTSMPSKDVYLRTPDLLKNFLLRLTSSTSATLFQDYNVVDATFLDDAVAANVVLSVQVEVANGTLNDFLSGLGGGTAFFTLIPRFFRVVTDGIPDSLPTNSQVKIQFEATGADPFGNPDTTNILVPLTGDIAQFNALAPGSLRFFRFQVEFDLDAGGAGLMVTTKPVGLDFLRMPFRF